MSLCLVMSQKPSFGIASVGAGFQYTGVKRRNWRSESCGTSLANLSRSAKSKGHGLSEEITGRSWFGSVMIRSPTRHRSPRLAIVGDIIYLPLQSVGLGVFGNLGGNNFLAILGAVC